MRCMALVLAVLAVFSVGCGGAEVSDDQDVSLLLDFTPNAAHVGIFTAQRRAFDAGEGVHLHVRIPGQSTDAVRLLAAGKVDLAVLDIHDLALARARGVDLVGVAAIVERPLAAVIARPGIRSPRELAGRRVGVTGLPSDLAVLRSIAGNGTRPVTIGFSAVSALLSGRVAAATAFWDVEGVALQRRRPGYRIFKVDEHGAPSYPELVLCATRQTLRDEPDAVRGVVRALRRGYEQALTDPESSVADLVTANRGLDQDLVTAELSALSTAFQDPAGRIGALDMPVLRRWARWEKRFGIVKRVPDVRRMFVPVG